MVQNSRPRKIALLVVTLLLIFSSSCTPQEISPDGDISQDTSPGTSEEGLYPGYLGFVDDPAGEPVAFASLGGTETTTWEGVGSGEFSGYEGGWLPVESMGYATGYAYLHPPEDGFSFFVTTLTPFQSLMFYESGDPINLYGFHGEDFRVTTEIPEDIFQEMPVFVGLAALDPLDVKPRYADTELEKGLRVQQAIALQAFDKVWEPLELAPGATMTLHLEFDQPPSASAAFAVFDPDAGIWRTLGPACTSLDPNTYACELSSFTPLLGVFDFPSEPLAFDGHELQLSGTTLGSLLLSMFLPQEGDGGSGGGIDGTIDQIEDWLKQQQEESGGADPNDPTIKNLIDQLIKQALEQAANNRTESGKKMLLQVQDVVIAVGQPNADAPLNAELAKISNEIGEKALKESDCGEFKKLLKAAEQIQRMGGSIELEHQLTEKAAEMVVDCDVWTGDIVVSMNSVSQHPAGLPMRGSGGNWVEIHKLKIWTNVEDFVMHGESKVTHLLPTANFSTDKECKSEIQISGLPGETSIYFEGFYNGYEFRVHSVTPQGGATIKQRWTMRAKENETCETVHNQEFSFSPYYSLVVHGVSSDSPPINIQEILDTGAADPSSDGLIRFSGYQILNNPDPELGIYPFQTGYINWNFWHMEMKLPSKKDK